VSRPSDALAARAAAKGAFTALFLGLGAVALLRWRRDRQRDGDLGARGRSEVGLRRALGGAGAMSPRSFRRGAPTLGARRVAGRGAPARLSPAAMRRARRRIVVPASAAGGGLAAACHRRRRRLYPAMPQPACRTEELRSPERQSSVPSRPAITIGTQAGVSQMSPAPEARHSLACPAATPPSTRRPLRHAHKVLTILLVCPICATERVVEADRTPSSLTRPPSPAAREQSLEPLAGAHRRSMPAAAPRGLRVEYKQLIHSMEFAYAMGHSRTLGRTRAPARRRPGRRAAAEIAALEDGRRLVRGDGAIAQPLRVWSSARPSE